MKACMVAYTFYEADNRVRRYAEALAKRGDEVDVIALRRDKQARSETIRGVRVHRIQRRRIDEKGPLSYLVKLLAFFVRSTWWLSWHALKDGFDLIHVHSVPDFQVFATLIPRLAGAKVILDIHDIVPEFYASKFKVNDRSLAFRVLVIMERISTWYSSHVIISNHLWHTKLIQRSVRAEKCTAIINYPDLSIFCRNRHRRAGSDEFVLCYPGTLNQHQGLDLAVRAVSQVCKSAPHIRLRIIGDGPDRENLKKLVTQLGLDNLVTIDGFVPLEEVSTIMANVDLGIVPKRSDSFGNEAFSTKIMEFMAMGVPVLAARTAVDQFYFNEDLVHFFEPQNVSDLAAKILELARDQGRRETLRNHGIAFIEQNNWDVRRNEYLDLVDRLVSKGSLCEEPA